MFKGLAFSVFLLLNYNNLHLKLHDSHALVFFLFIYVFVLNMKYCKIQKKMYCLLVVLEGLNWFLKRFVRPTRLNNNVICVNCDTARLPPTLTNS